MFNPNTFINMILKKPICNKKERTGSVAATKGQATKTPRTAGIPTGTSKEDVYVRRAIIVERLAPLIGTSVPCRAFKGKRVEVVFDSIDETATRASKRYESTLAALRLVEALKKATLERTDTPHSNKQKKMRFKKVHELQSYLSSIGKVKMIVGERNNGLIIHYCITKKQE